MKNLFKECIDNHIAVVNGKPTKFHDKITFTHISNQGSKQITIDDKMTFGTALLTDYNITASSAFSSNISKDTKIRLSRAYNDRYRLQSDTDKLYTVKEIDELIGNNYSIDKTILNDDSVWNPNKLQLANFARLVAQEIKSRRADISKLYQGSVNNFGIPSYAFTDIASRINATSHDLKSFSTLYPNFNTIKIIDGLYPEFTYLLTEHTYITSSYNTDYKHVSIYNSNSHVNEIGRSNNNVIVNIGKTLDSVGSFIDMSGGFAEVLYNEYDSKIKTIINAAIEKSKHTINSDWMIKYKIAFLNMFTGDEVTDEVRTKLLNGDYSILPENIKVAISVSYVPKDLKTLNDCRQLVKYIRTYYNDRSNNDVGNAIYRKCHPSQENTFNFISTGINPDYMLNPKSEFYKNSDYMETSSTSFSNTEIIDISTNDIFTGKLDTAIKSVLPTMVKTVLASGNSVIKKLVTCTSTIDKILSHSAMIKDGSDGITREITDKKIYRSKNEVIIKLKTTIRFDKNDMASIDNIYEKLQKAIGVNKDDFYINDL